MKHALILLALAAGAAQAQHTGGHDMHHGANGAGKSTQGSPYAGMQSREIKALSADDAAKLQQGHGMSLALAAELNGYPGPSHVLELADQLQLTPTQRAQTQSLMDSHRADARELGRQIVEAERQLDAAFKGGRATAEEVTRQTRRIGELQGQLRDTHLQTHLKQKALLTPQQVAQYNVLRGYAVTSQHGGHR